MFRENRYRHTTPPGWNNITAAPRDGTPIEIQNNWGVAPWFELCKWVHGRGWVQVNDESRGMGDGSHLSWRPYSAAPAEYVDPTGGRQMDPQYWRDAINRS